jgi:tRNA (guanine37-N1)-methyltransferase
VDGVIKKDSSDEDSFSHGLLEYPQYTRPEIYDGKRVPEVLLSGHHANIEKWRHQMSIKNTVKHRPDLLKELEFNEEDQNYVNSLLKKDEI